MAGLEALQSHLYHEKQQPGSMLCAQHALNSLLQGHYFTAPDLSVIASGLDTLEESYEDDRGRTSTNMDDTGFFSVQVLEKALEVWGLNLVRWRSEALREYQDRPYVQLGFILNLEQHWFTLRRFGPALPSISDDPGEGHWFNLNSFNTAPEWVSKTYLGMVLQQSEAEGYSVFAVVQVDPEAPLALPRVLADEIAATLPGPTSAAPPSSAASKGRMSPSVSHPEGLQVDNFEDEDWELQAALQASLMQQTGGDEHETQSGGQPSSSTAASFAPLPTATPPSISSPRTPQGWGPRAMPPNPEPDPINDTLDPVAASMARSRQLLERFQAEQELAQRELWSETDLTPEEAQALQERRERRQREEEREAEELRKAIEESEKLANEHRSKRARASEEGENEDVEMDTGTSASPSVPPFAGSSTHLSDQRTYDDEDAELQAALQASLESVPATWKEPEPAPYQAPQYPTPTPMTTRDKADNASIASTETSTTETDSEEKPASSEPLDLDEVRRRRLARFGL
ncbi:machado-joseph disease 1 [Coprinopsis sp. MPI-PUGE-AT-0042]|nr:machado-joseph disease 1 [Coprinopsis sp. MPI-PUGE-AT-0042]